MSDDARERLAADQARLVDALTGRSEPPVDFDAARVELLGQTLASKRAKTVARAWLVLAESLGDDFAARFNAFAQTVSPHEAGPGADGFAFANWLDSQGLLPRRAAAEYLVARLWRGLPMGLRLRRGEGRLFLGVRLPFLGVRLFSVPWRG